MLLGPARKFIRRPDNPLNRLRRRRLRRNCLLEPAVFERQSGLRRDGS
jgi:hypothetical protein